MIFRHYCILLCPILSQFISFEYDPTYIVMCVRMIFLLCLFRFFPRHDKSVCDRVHIYICFVHTMTHTHVSAGSKTGHAMYIDSCLLLKTTIKQHDDQFCVLSCIYSICLLRWICIFFFFFTWYMHIYMTCLYTSASSSVFMRPWSKVF